MPRTFDVQSSHSADLPDSYPLTSIQSRILFLESLSPGTSDHLVPLVIRIHGPLDSAKFEDSLRELPDRIPELRLALIGDDGDTRQFVRPNPSYEFELHDLGEVPAAEQPDARRNILRDRGLRPFMLDGSYLRFILIRETDERWTFCLVLHRVLGDEALAAETYRRLTAIYTREESTREELPLSAPRHVIAEQEYLASGAEDSDVEFWKRYLAGAPDALDLSTDRPRPSVQRTETHRVACNFRSEVNLAREIGFEGRDAPEWIPYAAGFAALLYRYTRHPELILGVVLRRASGTVTVPLRLSLTPLTPFRDLVLEVKRQYERCEPHARLPFDRILEAVQPERNLARAPLFQAAVEWRDDVVDVTRAGDVEFIPEELDHGWSELDAALVVSAARGGVRGIIELNAALFDRTTGGRWATHLATLVRGAIEAPESPIGALPILSPEEREQLLVTWNADRLDYPRQMCIHQLIAREAVRYPDHTAIVFGEQRITYGELDLRANQLAHFLQAMNVGPDVFVGVCMDRRPDLVIALLAVMKAGGAYVPLDPRYPADRVAFMLQDTNAPVVLTNASIAPSLPAGSSEVVAVDAMRETIATMPETPPPTAVTAEHLAYVIYTSGSTGVPKGVAIAHRPGIALFFWARQIFTDADLRGMLASTSVCFDLSVFEIFFPLCFGGRIILVDNVLEILESPAAREITLINTVPSAMNELIRLDGVPKSVTTVCLAGEPLPPSLAGAIYRLPHVTHLYNLYGPSEDTTYSTWALVPRGDEPLVTIGRPISNTQAYVLDPDLQPTPVGVPGELYLAGDGLARGYHGRPELTAERFVRNPFDAGDAPRMYRTGDLVKYLPDGQLLYLGRLDHQVKIRGFRIELGEIQTVLERHDAVREAAVVVREETPGDKRIVAYVALDDRRCGIEDLRSHVAGFVPPYMVPSAIVVLDALPRTPNGKLDRKALPAPATSDAGASDEGFANSMERSMAALWREVLQTPVVRRRDSFFALGGHSLLATQLTARVRDAFGVAVPLREIFERPSLDEYAHAVSAQVESGARDTGAPILALPYAEPEPLSCAQEGLWFLEQYHPGQSSYVIPVAFRLRGTLNTSALETAINDVVACHEALRTSFELRDGQPVQVVAPAVHVALDVIDVQHVPANEREAEVAKHAAEAAAVPFDLGTAPLMRAVLYRLFDDDYVLFLPQHHIISDGWSLGILSTALADAYAHACDENTQPIKAPRYQYRDFARWQHAMLESARTEALVSYWRSRLAGAPPALELETDFPRPPTPSYQGARESLVLSDVLTRTLTSWCRDENTTPYTVLLAAVFALMYRYTGQRQIVLGAAMANRDRAEWEGVYGYFVNSLPIREDLDSEIGFANLTRQLHRHLIEDREHQDLPFDRIVDAVLPERDASRHPLFQVMVVMQPTPISRTSHGGIQFEASEWANGSSKFDLTFSLQECPDGIQGYLEYDTALFKPATVRRMAGHLRELLHDALREPSKPLAELNLLTSDERRQLLAWAENRTEYPRNWSVPALFERHVERSPDAIALRWGEIQWSYRKLDAAANQLAHYLRERGVQRGSVVGLHAARSPELVAAILGILKTGAAYVPIDPEYPEERVHFMIEHARVELIIGDGDRDWGNRQFIRLDSFWEDHADLPASNPGVTIAPTDCAYIMYTSGSTGTPKGVRVPHRAIARLVCNTNYISVSYDDVFLLLAPISFDASTFEIWGALLNGARLAVMSPEQVSIRNLRAAILRENVTVLWLTAGLFHVVVEEDLEALRPLRWLLAGGDVLRPEAVRRCLEAHPHCTVINGYGPTENTTFTCCFPMTAPEQVGHTVPIGRPIANSSVYIVDDRAQLAPLGVPGELCTGGDGLSLGYHNAPELTAERFVPNPFSDPPGGVMYRTGDRARFRDDGSIEFLGRLDTQVKIRGFRIELEEIEHTLSQHPAVRTASVITAEHGTSEKQLHAFVVFESGADVESVADHARRRLPAYMIPTTIQAVDALPLTPNGKVDRRALAGRITTSAHADESEPPQGALENDIARHWSELLHVEAIGRNANFFALGGHSLLATQLSARLSAACGVDVPVRTVFEHPTVAGLARAIEAIEFRQESDAIPRLTRVPREQPLPLSYTQRRLWFLEQLHGGTSAYVIPAVLRLEGPLDVDALQRAVSALVNRHDILRAVFVAEDGQPFMRICDNADAGIRTTELDHVPLAEAERLAQRVLVSEAATPFNLETGPVIRFHLVKLAAEQHYLAISVHHIVSDGWSQQILVRELGTIYTGIREGREPGLPPQPVQYPDYAAWQREWLHGAPLHRRLTFWRTHLEGAPLALDLPTDYPRPPVQRPVGRRYAFELDAPTRERLHEYCRAHGVTPYIVLLSAFYALLSRLSGREDMVIGSVLANRRQLELQSMVGFFANTLALRAQVDRDLTFSMLVALVHDHVLAALDHQELPLDALVDAMHPSRDRSRSPLIQVIFSLNNVDNIQRSWNGLNVTALEIDNGSSKFDLSLLMEECPESVTGFFEFNSDLFSMDTIARWTRSYQWILAQAIEHKHEPIHRLGPDPDALPQQPASWSAGDADVHACLDALSNPNASTESSPIAVMTPAEAAHRLAHGTFPADRRLLCLPGGMIVPALARRVLDSTTIERIVGVFGIEGGTAALAAAVDKDSVDAIRYRPVPGIEVEVVDGLGSQQIAGVPGELIVRDGGTSRATGLVARQTMDGALEILGRPADIVDVRGIRIYLHEVDDALLRNAAVREACVLHAENGVLNAFIVMAESADVDSVKQALREVLPDSCMPAHIVPLPELPLTESGDYDKVALAATPVGEVSNESAQVSALEESLTAIWQDLLHVNPVGRNENFFDLGGHSLLATRLLARLRNEFEFRITLDDIYAYPTVAELARFVASPHRTSPVIEQVLDPCLVAIKATGSRTPFFCVSGAGGPVFNYFNLAPYLHPEQPFFGLQAPSLEDRSQQFDRIEDLAAYYVSAIQGRQPVGPYLVGGWSFGGAVAFEIARQLRAKGCDVAFVGLIDAEATVPPRTLRDRARLMTRLVSEKVRGRTTMTLHTMPLLARYARDGAKMVFARLAGRAGKVVSLRDYVRWVIRDQASQYFLKQAGIAQRDALGSRADLLQDERVRLITDVFTSNEAMLRRYTFDPYPGKITLFRAKHDPWRRRAMLGWDEVSESVTVHEIEGNHLVIFRTPYVADLGEKLNRCLAEAQGLEA